MATAGQNYWPPAGSFMAITGQSLLAADNGHRRRAPADSPPVGYTTSLEGQGPAARVVYRSADGHVQELSVVSP